MYSHLSKILNTKLTKLKIQKSTVYENYKQSGEDYLF